jgi:hypothetical protein
MARGRKAFSHPQAEKPLIGFKVRKSGAEMLPFFMPLFERNTAHNQRKQSGGIQIPFEPCACCRALQIP